MGFFQLADSIFLSLEGKYESELERASVSNVGTEGQIELPEAGDSAPQRDDVEAGCGIPDGNVQPAQGVPE